MQIAAATIYEHVSTMSFLGDPETQKPRAPRQILAGCNSETWGLGYNLGVTGKQRRSCAHSVVLYMQPLRASELVPYSPRTPRKCTPHATIIEINI